MWAISGLYTNSKGEHVKLLGLATNDVTEERIVIYTEHMDLDFPMKFMPENSFRAQYILFSRIMEANYREIG